MRHGMRRPRGRVTSQFPGPKLSAVSHRVLPALLGCLVFVFAAPALAQPAARAPTQAEREAARQAYEEGSALYERGEYVRAIEAFERAHGITGAPELLYNIYTAAQRARELQRASDALSAYLASDAVPAEERPALSERLSRLAEEIEAEQRAQQDEAEAQRTAEARLREAEARAAENAPRVSSGHRGVGGRRGGPRELRDVRRARAA